MSRLGSTALLGRERQLLDGEEQPHRERQRRQYAGEPEREERAVALGQLRRRPGAMFRAQRAEVDVGRALILEHGEHGERQQRHDQR